MPARWDVPERHRERARQQAPRATCTCRCSSLCRAAAGACASGRTPSWDLLARQQLKHPMAQLPVAAVKTSCKADCSCKRSRGAMRHARGRHCNCSRKLVHELPRRDSPVAPRALQSAPQLRSADDQAQTAAANQALYHDMHVELVMSPRCACAPARLEQIARWQQGRGAGRHAAPMQPRTVSKARRTSRAGGAKQQLPSN